MKRAILTSAAALVLGAPAAFAGNVEPVVVEPAPVVAVTPTYTGGDWTGGYAGVQFGHLDVDGTGAADGDEVIYGLHAGYDYDFGQFVLGGEVDFDTGDLDLGGAATVDNVTRIKLKAGYDLGQTMIYATAGAAQVNTSIGDETGPFGGLGLSYAVSEQFSVGGEVLYHEFDDIGGTGVGADATSVTLRGSFRF